MFEKIHTRYSPCVWGLASRQEFLGTHSSSWQRDPKASKCDPLVCTVYEAINRVPGPKALPPLFPNATVVDCADDAELQTQVKDPECIFWKASYRHTNSLGFKPRLFLSTVQEVWKEGSHTGPVRVRSPRHTRFQPPDIATDEPV